MMSCVKHWNKIEILYNGKLQEMWRIERNFVYSLGNSTLSSTFPKVFRCTKFQFCSSEKYLITNFHTLQKCEHFALNCCYNVANCTKLMLICSCISINDVVDIIVIMGGIEDMYKSMDRWLS